MSTCIPRIVLYCICSPYWTLRVMTGPEYWRPRAVLCTLPPGALLFVFVGGSRILLYLPFWCSVATSFVALSPWCTTCRLILPYGATPVSLVHFLLLPPPLFFWPMPLGRQVWQLLAFPVFGTRSKPSNVSSTQRPPSILPSAHCM